MQRKVRMTSKRQVTFPAAVCESLSVYPGDTLTLQDARVNGRKVWILEPPSTAQTPAWMGSLRAYAERKETHAISAIRSAIARKRGAGE